MILSHILLWWTTCLLHLLPTCTFQLPILPLECHNPPSLCLLPICNCEFPCLSTYKILDKFIPHGNISALSADTQISISMRPSCQTLPYTTQLVCVLPMSWRHSSIISTSFLHNPDSGLKTYFRWICLCRDRNSTYFMGASKWSIHF